jgi:hypothetical protein
VSFASLPGRCIDSSFRLPDQTFIKIRSASYAKFTGVISLTVNQPELQAEHSTAVIICVV